MARAGALLSITAMAEAISERTGREVSYSTLRRIEMGERPVEVDVLQAVADVTGQPLPWLLGLDDDVLATRAIPGQLKRRPAGRAA